MRIFFDAPRGKNGFGHDALFVPLGFEQMFGELGEDEKNINQPPREGARPAQVFCLNAGSEHRPGRYFFRRKKAFAAGTGLDTVF